MPALILILSAALGASPTPPSASVAPFRIANAESAPKATGAPSPVPSIDSILQDQTDNEPEDGGPSPPPASGTAPPSLPPPVPDAKAYDARVVEMARAAQAMRGPLDGGWTLASTDGRPLYRFQLVDNGQGVAQPEGAWRDLRAGTRATSAGFLTSVNFDGLQLMLRFYESGPDDLAVVVVRPVHGEGWTGQFWRAGASIPVTFRRP